jgi:uncharacterized membrane protein YdjX (TVP38/TMEM64 family)
MKDLLKIALVLAIVFASTFVLFERTGLITEDRLRAGLDGLMALHPAWVAGAVVLLLLLDLAIAVPTMTTILLAGFLLGPWLGGLASAAGLMLLGTVGYGLGRRFGRPLLGRIYGDAGRLERIEAAFARNDLLVLFTCQALPILPELSCCLAGVARMRPGRFLFGYAVGVVPFAFIVAWGGAASAPDNLTPAILTCIAVSVALLTAWTLLVRRSGRTAGQGGS